MVGALLTGCGELAKVATRGNANATRAALRQVCADISEADRLAGAVLDAPDAGTP